MSWDADCTQCSYTCRTFAKPLSVNWDRLNYHNMLRDALCNCVCIIYPFKFYQEAFFEKQFDSYECVLQFPIHKFIFATRVD